MKLIQVQVSTKKIASKFWDSTPDCALRDHSTLGAVTAARGTLLDREAAVGDADDERRVVESAGLAALAPRDHRFEDAAVQAHRMPARAERQPVEVDARAGAHDPPSVGPRISHDPSGRARP